MFCFSAQVCYGVFGMVKGRTPKVKEGSYILYSLLHSEIVNLQSLIFGRLRVGVEKEVYYTKGRVC